MGKTGSACNWLTKGDFSGFIGVRCLQKGFQSFGHPAQRTLSVHRLQDPDARRNSRPLCPRRRVDRDRGVRPASSARMLGGGAPCGKPPRRQGPPQDTNVTVAALRPVRFFRGTLQRQSQAGAERSRHSKWKEVTTHNGAVMRRGFASAHLAAGSRRFGRVADWCALLRIVSWLPLWVRSCEALPSTLNGGGFHRVRSWRDMVSATLPCGRGWRGRSISVVGNGRSRELFDALELAR